MTTEPQRILTIGRRKARWQLVGLCSTCQMWVPWEAARNSAGRGGLCFSTDCTTKGGKDSRYRKRRMLVCQKPDCHQVYANAPSFRHHSCGSAY